MIEIDSSAGSSSSSSSLSQRSLHDRTRSCPTQSTMNATSERSGRSERSDRSSFGGDALAGRSTAASEPIGAATSSSSSSSSLMSLKPPKFDFFQKRRSVMPLALPSELTSSNGDNGEDNSCDQHDVPEPLLFLNETPEFDLRSLFRRPNATGDPTLPHHREKRRLRAREELCLMTPKTLNRAKNAWFLSPGFIGRDNHEHTVVCTKDAGMDAVHAEVLIDGDDYLVRDCSNSSGTYLCLSTTNRHHPQRDGFRLRNGDTFLLGLHTTVVVHDLCVAPIHDTADVAPYDHLQQQIEPNESATDDNVNGDEHAIPKPRRVHFGAVIDLADGTPIVGNRYKRKTKLHASPYEPLHPVSITVSITVAGKPVTTNLQLAGKTVFLIGSSHVCDLHIPTTETTGASDIHGVHARIVFDGCFYVLQDLSFEENPRRKTRVALTQATRIGRGDCLLFGACALFVVNVARAFRDHEPDMKEVAIACHVLRPSKRKPRAKRKYIPFGFRHHAVEPFVAGKGRHCDGHIFTAALNVEQFALQLDHGACALVPRAAGINQGVYFLLGRDCMLHDAVYTPDLVRYTSKALMLVDGSVFKVGSTELEVVFVKSDDSASDAAQRAQVAARAQLLATMPWLEQIARDRTGLENIAHRGQRLVLAPGDVVYDAGDRATFLFVVISGAIELSAPSPSSPSNVPSSWRLSAIEGYLSASASVPPPTSATDDPHTSTSTSSPELVPAGSYFGEVSLCSGPAASAYYSERATAAAPTEVLALRRTDVVGYLAHYMDIVAPHVAYERHKELLHKLRVHVTWLRDVTYQDLRVLAAKAEVVTYELGDAVVADGVFQIHGAPRSGGMLLLGYGNAVLVGSCSDPTSVCLSGDNSSAHTTPALWRASEPIVCSTTLPLDPMFQNVQARSRVECFFFDSSHVTRLMDIAHTDSSSGTNSSTSTSVVHATSHVLPQHARTQHRRSSFVAMQQRTRHSQVVLPTTLGAGATDSDNDTDNPPSNSNSSSTDVDDALSDPSQKWRRKKRNKQLLEKTILETQQNGSVANALVLYVLAGANRGDVFVVHNVATLGSLQSDADIALNDAYVSRDQAVIQHRDGRFWLYDTASAWGTFMRLEENQPIQVHAGDVFVAGEVEFTCLAAFPARKKTQICCIQ